MRRGGIIGGRREEVRGGKRRDEEGGRKGRVISRKCWTRVSDAR
jgi:hypothetical protein